MRPISPSESKRRIFGIMHRRRTRPRKVCIIQERTALYVFEQSTVPSAVLHTLCIVELYAECDGTLDYIHIPPVTIPMGDLKSAFPSQWDEPHSAQLLVSGSSLEGDPRITGQPARDGITVVEWKAHRSQIYGVDRSGSPIAGSTRCMPRSPIFRLQRLR